MVVDTTDKTRTRQNKRNLLSLGTRTDVSPLHYFIQFITESCGLGLPRHDRMDEWISLDD